MKELFDEINSSLQRDGEQGFRRMISLRHEFPTEWNRFLHPPATIEPGGAKLTIPVIKGRFPFLFQNRSINIQGFEIFVKVNQEFSTSHNESTLKLSLQAGSNASTIALVLSAWNGLLQTEEPHGGPLGDWTMAAWLDIGTDLKQNLD